MLTLFLAGIHALDQQLGNKFNDQQESQFAGYAEKAYNQFSKKN